MPFCHVLFLTSETLFDFLLFFEIPRICNKVQTVSILSDIHRKLNYFPLFILSHIQTYYNILSPFFVVSTVTNTMGFISSVFFIFWYLSCCAKLEFRICTQKTDMRHRMCDPILTEFWTQTIWKKRKGKRGASKARWEWAVFFLCELRMFQSCMSYRDTGNYTIATPKVKSTLSQWNGTTSIWQIVVYSRCCLDLFE